MAERMIDIVKVFSTTKRGERDRLGDRVTAWLRSRPDVTPVQTTVLLSSDAEYHCLSIVLLGSTQ